MVQRSVLVAALGVIVVAAAIVLNYTGRDPAPPMTVSPLVPPAGQAEPDRAPPAATAWTAPAGPDTNAREGGQTPPNAPSSLPRFDVVRVTPEGDAVLAGRAEPGARVVITDRDRPIGETTADHRGEWVFLPEAPLAPGERWLGLEVHPADDDDSPAPRLLSDDLLLVIIPDRADPGTGSPASAATRALVMQIPRDGAGPATVLQVPAEPSAEDVPAGLALAITAVDRDAAGQLTISGHAPESAAVNVYVGDTFVGQAVADEQGRWLLRPHAWPDGSAGGVRADQVDAAGQVLARVAVPFVAAETLAGMPLATPEPDDGVATPLHTVVIRPGENLWRIARTVYGTGFAYTEIYEANRDQIRDPDLIYPGQVFTLPPVH
ncbi:MAG: LysM peptidoglycan-binding domain-containing protein [Rhodospirillales bacterium]|nr:MAG: LysM peptidoglycan-binding domain-containing protein [Rhodospirillales bacterium]